MNKPYTRTASMLGAAFLLLATQVAFAHDNFDEAFDDPDKPWQEIALRLPPPPQQKNLIEFYVGPTTTQTFAIDAQSLSVDADGVVRYTLVATSPAGAKNISYEGIRCATFEKKLYAFGRNDGSWGRSRRDQWEGIVRNQVNRQHAALAQEYFCQTKTIVGKEKDILQRLRTQNTLIDTLLTE